MADTVFNEYTTQNQTSAGWNLSWDALGRYPMVAKRRFATLAEAQKFVDYTGPGASATEGLIIAVIADETAKYNGVYWVKSVANTDLTYGDVRDKGELVKVGGADIETAAKYTDAVELSKTLITGQLIKVASSEKVVVDGTEKTYQAGFYIVDAPGTISALATSSGSDDEIGDLRQDLLSFKESTNTALSNKANRSEVTASLDLKADKSTVEGLETEIGKVDDKFKNYTTTTDLTSLLNGKADVATTLAGYNISDAYTKTQVDAKFTEVNNKLAEWTPITTEEIQALVNGTVSEGE